MWRCIHGVDDCLVLITPGMNDFTTAFHTAFKLIGSFDAELRGIVLLSLSVSLTASACAFAIIFRRTRRRRTPPTLPRRP